MAKLPFKTWTQKDANKLKQLVKDFNRKRREFESPVTPQPPKITYGELKKTISSRAEYNRVMGVYGRYLRPGAERPYKNNYGLRITQWERKEAIYANRRINADRARTLKKLNPSTTRGTMGTVEANNLAPRTDFTATYTGGRENYLKYWKSAQKQANVNYRENMNAALKQNYLKAMARELNAATNYKELRKLVNSLTVDELMEGMSADPVLGMEFVYRLDLSPNERVDYMLDKWEYLKDNG